VRVFDLGAWLAPPGGTVDELERRAVALAEHRIDGTRAVGLTLAEWARLREEVQGAEEEGPSHRRRLRSLYAAAGVPEGHIARYVSRSRAGRWDDAFREIDQLAEVAELPPLVWYDRGQQLAALGRNAEAAADFRRAAAGWPDGPAGVSEALALLAADKLDDYRRRCRALVQQKRPRAVSGQTLAMMLLLDAQVLPLDELLERVGTEVEALRPFAGTGTVIRWLEGAALVRAGRPHCALERLGAWGPDGGGKTPIELFFTALALGQLGREDEARRYLELGRQTLQKRTDLNWPGRVMAQAARREAERLLPRRPPAADVP
jgi:tetratricopeptide (TPR) repeat protein